MKRIVLLTIIVTAAQAVLADPLWQEAVDLYAAFGDLLPGRMEISFEQYNGRGNLVTAETTEIDVWVDTDGEVRSEILRATRNGEDVTEERRENPQSGGPPFGGGTDEREDDEEGGPFSGLQRSPFDPEEQANVVVTEPGAVELIDGTRARRYDFVHTTGPDTATTGSAWLSAETGEPIRVEATIEPLPPLVDEFVIRQHYGRDEQDRWVTKLLEFDGTGNVLFIRRRIESRMVFSDYFRSD